MKHLLLALTATALVSACGGMLRGPTLNIAAPFDESQAKLLLADGSNTIKGNAFLRQRGGGVVTCAGGTVHLIPGTDYAKQRIHMLYGASEARGYSLAPTISPDVPAYYTNIRKTQCDSQGRFEFDRVADGEFIVQATVSWTVGNNNQGASLIKRVTTDSGKTINIIMAQ